MFAGKNTVAKDLRPKFTLWRKTTVSKDIKSHKRRSRRVYKQYLRSGDIRLFVRSQRKLTRWDFD